MPSFPPLFSWLPLVVSLAGSVTLSHPHRLDPHSTPRCTLSGWLCAPVNSAHHSLAVHSARSLCRLTAPRPPSSRRDIETVISCLPTRLALSAQTRTIHNHVCRTGPCRGHLHGQAERAGACRRLLSLVARRPCLTTSGAATTHSGAKPTRLTPPSTLELYPAGCSKSRRLSVTTRCVARNSSCLAVSVQAGQKRGARSNRARSAPHAHELVKLTQRFSPPVRAHRWSRR